MLAGAHAGFMRRFENLVDPDHTLPDAERQVRAARLLRSHMLALAVRSAKARRSRANSVETRRSNVDPP